MSHVPKTTRYLIALLDQCAGEIVTDHSPKEPQAELLVLRPLWEVVQRSLGTYGVNNHGLTGDDRAAYLKVQRWMSILEALYAPPDVEATR